MTPIYATPKGNLSLSNIGPGIGTKDIGKGGQLTFKTTKDKLTGSIQLSDGTFSFNNQFINKLRKFQDVIVKADYKVKDSITANGSLDVGLKKYTVGATWDGKIADKKTTLKGWYSTRDDLAWGETTVNVNSQQKAFVSFNQKRLISAKYTINKGTFTAEPGYNFLKSSPSVALTKKLKNKDTIKLTHDVKSESSAVEYNHTPFKVVLSTKLGKSLKVGRPTLAMTFEKTYEL